MKVLIHPPKKDWTPLLQRPYTDQTAILKTVQTILEAVRKEGDKAVKNFTRQYDGVFLEDFALSPEEQLNAETHLPDELKTAIQIAKKNIHTFHKAQLHEGEKMTIQPGIQCWRKSVPIDKVGIYIPGGTAPLFSTVLMLGIPAQLAGCREVVLCTPCNREGLVHPAIIYTARLTGIKRIFKIGGAQAIAAMAFGTETIPSVYKIFGPGNQYVTAAKQMVQQHGISIDMPAGPSEVCVLADETADAAFVAADLLSQAEHGADSQVLLVSASQEVVQRVMEEVQIQLQELPRKERAQKALENSKAIVVKTMEEAIELVNEYAAEHLIICCNKALDIAEKITNAGSVFIGNHSPESVGDYASGTNHTLPTNGFAKAYSGVSVDSFVKKITYQKLSPQGLRKIAPTVIAMAEAEGLKAHAEAVRIRIKRDE